jgi:hypothetical protein
MRRLLWWIAPAALLACSGDSGPSSEESSTQLNARPAPAITYQAVDLGTLGGSLSVAQGINSLGVAVGYSQRGGDPYSHAVFWRTPGSQGPEALSELPGTIESLAFDINANGDIVGMSGGLPDGPHATLWPAGGGVLDLGVASGLGYTGIFINALGEIVWAIGGTPGTNTPIRTLLWRQGALSDLGAAFPNNTNLGLPIGISDKGVIAVTGGRYWDRGAWKDLAVPANATGVLIANRVTSSGQVLGNTGGGVPNDLGLWWRSPTRLTVLVPDFIPWDISAEGVLFGETRRVRPTGQEDLVPATYTAKRGVSFLPVPANNIERGRVIRINRSGIAVGYTYRQNAVISSNADPRATTWIPGSTP